MTDIRGSISAVVCVAASITETVVLCVFGEQFLLVYDGIALALQIIVTTEAEVQRRNTVFITCSGLHTSSFPAARQTHFYLIVVVLTAKRKCAITFFSA